MTNIEIKECRMCSEDSPCFGFEMTKGVEVTVFDIFSDPPSVLPISIEQCREINAKGVLSSIYLDFTMKGGE